MKFSAVFLALTGSLVSGSPIAKEAPSRVLDARLAPPPAVSPIILPTDYPTVAINAHNLHRLNHSAPPASWNADLASYAATVAATCVFAHDQSVGGGGYGQNIAEYSSSGNIETTSASYWVNSAVTDQWYNNEEPFYPAADYGLPTPDLSAFGEWGHFSQVVWVASTQVGCASQYCPEGTLAANYNSWFTVCNYQATGNVATEYGKNVLPPLGMVTITV